MIRMRIGLPDGERQLVLLGLEAGNIDKLKEGKPILIEPASLGLEHAIALVYGETQEAIIAQLAEHGLVSTDAAAVMREAAEEARKGGEERGAS